MADSEFERIAVALETLSIRLSDMELRLEFLESRVRKAIPNVLPKALAGGGKTGAAHSVVSGEGNAATNRYRRADGRNDSGRGPIAE
jgi:hypothetical protein